MVVRQLRINIVLIKQIIEIMNSVFNHPLMTPDFQKYWITDIGLYVSIFFFFYCHFLRANVFIKKGNFVVEIFYKKR